MRLTRLLKYLIQKSPVRGPDALSLQTHETPPQRCFGLTSIDVQLTQMDSMVSVLDWERHLRIETAGKTYLYYTSRQSLDSRAITPKVSCQARPRIGARGGHELPLATGSLWAARPPTRVGQQDGNRKAATQGRNRQVGGSTTAASMR